MSAAPRVQRWPFAVVAAAAVAACGDDSSAGLGDFSDACAAFRAQVIAGGPPKDGIPALTNPTLVSPGSPEAAYLLPHDRVIGVRAGAEVVAVPLNIGWWHEIVNLDIGGETLAISHCPLTGSSLVFDRAPLAGAEFGVSGLLFKNNLIMYDRRTNESLWPQMSRQALCGDAQGVSLEMHAVVETTWAAWVAAYPETRVISSRTGFSRDYTLYPYGAYRDVNNAALLFPFPIDTSRPPKELVLAIPIGSGGIAYPFGELAKIGDVAAVPVQPLDETIVFWDAAAQTAAAFSRRLNGSLLSFMVDADEIRDMETGSAWSVTGRAVSGPLTGQTLDGVPEAYAAYWFAWAAFTPDTEIWRAP